MTVLILLVASATLAGCLGGEEPQPEFSAVADGGTLYQGWAYDGTPSFPANASLSVTVDEVRNTGRVNVQGVWATNQSFTIDLTGFSHNEDDFHSGGIAANFVEHGDSGVGNTLLPAMDLLIATWSTGKIVVNGTAVNDTYADTDEWSTHLMVTDTGVRNETTGVVENGEGGTFSPDEPGKAAQGTDTEAILVVSSTYPNATRPDGNATLDDTIGARETIGKSFPVEAAGAQITIDVAISGAPQELGPYVFRLFGPEGGPALAQATLGTVSQTSSATLVANSTAAGDHTLRVQSQSTEAAFTAAASIVYPPKPVWLLHWEDVEVLKTVVSGA